MIPVMTSRLGRGLTRLVAVTSLLTVALHLYGVYDSCCGRDDVTAPLSHDIQPHAGYRNILIQNEVHAFGAARVLKVDKGSLESRDNQDHYVAAFQDAAEKPPLTSHLQAAYNRSLKEPVLPVSRQCDSDCLKLSKLFSMWPSDSPRAAIYYLTQGSRLSYLNVSLQALDLHFNHQFQYPIIIFHEHEFIIYHDAVRNMTRSPVFFQEVEFRVPDFVRRPVKSRIPCTSTISYRHMCRFHAKGVYDEPIMSLLDYYWRLDDDSRLIQRVPYNVFTYMRANHLDYGYQWIWLDASDCVEGLWEAASHFINTTHLKPSFFDRWKKPTIFYNNFEISSMTVWRSKEYRQYMDYVDYLGGIYHHRWGDAPIKGIALSLFLSSTRTHHFTDIGYEHRSFNSLDKKQSIMSL